MKKREFPTFLNEQPTVVFGRNMRELMVILVGLALSYTVWMNLGLLFPGSSIGVLLLKILCVCIVLIAALIVSLVKVASRPLEEWALVAIFYYCTPKIFLYMPFDGNERSGEFDSGEDQYQKSNNALMAMEDGLD